MPQEPSEQITQFPLVSSDSTVTEVVIAIVRRLSKAHSLSEIMEIVTHAARTRLARIFVTKSRFDLNLCCVRWRFYTAKTHTGTWTARARRPPSKIHNRTRSAAAIALSTALASA
jgi:hypothetical protein